MNDELVTVAVFLTLAEAELARGFLESQGIAASFADENIARMGVHFSALTGGVKLQVLAADEEAARELLASVDTERPASPDHEA